MPNKAAKKNIPAMLADTDFLYRQAKGGSDAFTQAQPFPHLLLPSFIKSSCCFALYEGLKPEDTRTESKSSVFRMLLWELSSSSLIRHFTALTGKPPLLPDPFLVHSGANTFAKNEIAHNAEQEFFLRHPETQLKNVLRMELFVSSEANGTFAIDLINKPGQVAVSHVGSNGCVLFVNSDTYHLHYRFKDPERWHSLIAYYYINDHARSLSEVEGSTSAEFNLSGVDGLSAREGGY